MSQVQAGKLDFLKVSGSVLERHSPAYKVLNLPFTLRDKAHWQVVATNDVGREIQASTSPSGLVGLTFYDAGSRSFYGQKPINHPDDLKGLRIRIQPSETMVRLMQMFGAEGVELRLGQCLHRTEIETGGWRREQRGGADRRQPCRRGFALFIRRAYHGAGRAAGRRGAPAEPDADTARHRPRGGPRLLSSHEYAVVRLRGAIARRRSNGAASHSSGPTRRRSSKRPRR